MRRVSVLEAAWTEVCGGHQITVGSLACLPAHTPLLLPGSGASLEMHKKYFHKSTKQVGVGKSKLFQGGIFHIICQLILI